MTAGYLWDDSGAEASNEEEGVLEKPTARRRAKAKMRGKCERKNRINYQCATIYLFFYFTTQSFTVVAEAFSYFIFPSQIANIFVANSLKERINGFAFALW